MIGMRRRWRALLQGRARRKLASYRLLRAFARAYPDAFFIQIGANDGVTDDQLRPFIASSSWSGIMVEPLRPAFERLKLTHASRLDRLALENVAIADRDGSLPLFHPAHMVDGRVAKPLEALASLSRETVEKTGAVFVPDDERGIVRTEVSCLTFESLCRKHAVRDLDLLMIDAEGYDHEILKQVDLSTLRPRLLVYEHLLLKPADERSCMARVEQLGYETMRERGDTWCLDTSADDAVTREWRRLGPSLAWPSIYRRSRPDEPRASSPPELGLWSRGASR
jgi:FkbM family methyltransferase